MAYCAQSTNVMCEAIPSSLLKLVKFQQRYVKSCWRALKFDEAMQANGVPEKVTIDKSGANKAAMDEINARGDTPVIVRQVKYLNNIVEQDHRAIKRATKPMLNFKSFRAAKNVLAGIELMHMIRKGQFLLEGCIKLSFAEQFYALAGQIRPV